ncbi:MAG: hypothetical protein RML84_03060 [Anaerolineae bacterium]|nr:hypothetical protein [Anaerolineae bacterium]
MSKVVKATVAVAVSALATLIGLAQAQEGLLAPMPTPIPETLPPAAPTPTPPAQEGTRGEQEATFDPQWVLWTPSSSVTFTVPYRQGQPSPITVRVSSDEGGLITSTARFVLAIDGIIGPEQPAVATSVVGTTTLDLTADIGNAPTGSLIRFRINKEDNTVLESPVYGIARRYFVFLPVTRRDEAQFVGAASACAAKGSPNARLTSQTVFYTPTVFFSDTWFYAENPNPNGIVQVRVRNYGGGGQVQVFYENPDCNNVLRMAPFGIAPNPVVTVSGVPTGPVYFRVVSPTVPATPFGIAWQAFPANTTACTAWSLPPNTMLSWTARNTNDYFAINLPGSDVFRIYVQGHPVTHTQVQLRSPLSGTCPSASTSLVGPFGIVNNGTAFLATGTSGGGTYYIRVVTLTQQPGTQAYQIRWEPVRTERPVFSTNPDQPQNCVTCAPDLNLPNPPVGGTRTYYWFRLNRTREGVDRNLLRVEIQIAGVNDLQPCPPGNPAAVAPYNTGNWVNISNSPYGAVTLQFNQAGGYNIRIRALDTSNAEYYYDAKPLRVGCG